MTVPSNSTSTAASTATATSTSAALAALDWGALAGELDDRGFAVTPPLLTPADCEGLRAGFDDEGLWRSTVVMHRHGYGQGVYRYYAHPLPATVALLREELYPPLAAIANRWAGLIGGPAYPATHGELVAECAAAGQTRPTPLILSYGPGDYNNLHQDLYGDVAFPLQVAIALSEPDVDFTGGESVFVEQRSRGQSRPGVARPRQGQGIVFPVRYRPVPGANGPKRVAMRHGVSTVLSGRREALGVIFHDAR
jgi:hypothetical protein